MKLTWELDWPGAHIEPSITSLAWFGDEEHGQLAVGNESGMVGITHTHLKPHHSDIPERYNFNLRGHHSPVTCVAWNTAKSKLASSDQSGVIYVWSRNEERWSVELVNERGVKVRSVSWSPTGDAALICYDDNFVLIGSSTGQRIWSNTYPTHSSVGCGVWLNGRTLVLAISGGSLQLISHEGANLTEKHVCDEDITRIVSAPPLNRIACITASGRLLVLKTLDQNEPTLFDEVYVSHVQWSHDGEHLLVASPSGDVLILTSGCEVVVRERVPVPPEATVSGMSWAHQSRVVLVGVGGVLHTGTLHPSIPSLLHLIAHSLCIHLQASSSKVNSLPLPSIEKQAILRHSHHTVTWRMRESCSMRSFVTCALRERTFCTITSSGRKTFTMCVEHMGGLVPMLVGRQVSRVLPHFHISLHASALHKPCVSQGPFAQVEDVGMGANSSHHRMSLWRRSKRRIRSLLSRRVPKSPQESVLAQVESNLTCTRFNVTCNCDQLPHLLAQVAYKTSLLHLQPRQMTVKVINLSQDAQRENTSPATLQLIQEDEVEEEGSDEERRLLVEEEEERWGDLLHTLQYIDGGEEGSSLPSLPPLHPLVPPPSVHPCATSANPSLRSSNVASTSNDRNDSFTEIRTQIRELEKKVDAMEKKAASGEVASQLNAVSSRVAKMKKALSRATGGRRVYTLHNKTPFWNEHNQVYQLDFGGRVTQESAKNFQIELDGEQCLQFGRVEGGSYTLDYRSPFTAVQAFALALASITQRLK